MAEIRVYVDADLLDVAKALVQVRYDVTYPGDPGDRNRGRDPCPVTSPSTPDHVWIPEVAAKGWIVIQRDRKMRGRVAERNAILAHGLRVVYLRVRREPSGWRHLDLVVRRWEQIEAVRTMVGPRTFRASHSRWTELPLT